MTRLVVNTLRGLAGLFVVLPATTGVAQSCPAIAGVWRQVIDKSPGCPGYQVNLDIRREQFYGKYKLVGNIVSADQSLALAGYANGQQWTVAVGPVANGILYGGYFSAKCDVVITIGTGACKASINLDRISH